MTIVKIEYEPFYSEVKLGIFFCLMFDIRISPKYWDDEFDFDEVILSLSGQRSRPRMLYYLMSVNYSSGQLTGICYKVEWVDRVGKGNYLIFDHPIVEGKICRWCKDNVFRTVGSVIL